MTARAWALAAALLVTSAACSKRGEPPIAPALQPSAAPQPPTAPQPPADRPSGRWQVRELRLRLLADADQRVAGVEAAGLRARFEAALRAAGPVRDVGAAAGVPRRDQLGLDLEIGWQRLDDRGRPQPLQAPGDGQLLVVAVAHAEAPGASPAQAEVAEHTRRALLPLASDVGDWPGWLQPRLERVAVAAAIEVMGELWAREAALDELTALLDSPQWWQVAAAAREIGERRVEALRPRLVKLCRDSRRDVAVVAVAALGRLGGEDSVATLVALVDHAPVEVVDAALVALSLLSGPAARAALAEIAGRDAGELSVRAKQLLGGAVPLPGAATAP